MLLQETQDKTAAPAQPTGRGLSFDQSGTFYNFYFTQITEEGRIVEEKDWRRRNLEIERREREESEDSRRRRRREEELRSNK